MLEKAWHGAFAFSRNTNHIWPAAKRDAARKNSHAFGETFLLNIIFERGEIE